MGFQPELAIIAVTTIVIMIGLGIAGLRGGRQIHS